jgi:peptidyl-prolyl cis-trans isomerase B (cyclophilin B)
MKTTARLLCSGAVAALMLIATYAKAQEAAPRVTLATTEGDIVVELNVEKAPVSSENFLQYVEDGFYAGTLFHRVIDGFMIQGGGFGEDYQRRETAAAIDNEADNGLKNIRYSIAMARTRDPHSATAQFFINTTDNPFLDHKSKDPAGWGYAVFGMVVEGQDVVDKIGKSATGAGGPFRSDVPKTPVVIKSASLNSKPKEEN